MMAQGMQTQANTEMGSESSVVSAPGKVLITGAYLVLESPNPGLILSTSARFYAIIAPLHASPLAESLEVSVQVLSPQLNRVANYALDLETLDLSSRRVGSANPFVETAIQYALAAAKLRSIALGSIITRGLAITILGDNDFYSHRSQIAGKGLPLCSDSLASLLRYSPATVNTPSESDSALEAAVPESIHTVPEIAKTGLGSSAAMVTAVVAGLLQHLGVVSLPRQGGPRNSRAVDSEGPSSRAVDLETVHRLSQAAHCAAQGKVGSGFDVSAAVFGSQRYVRFSPSVLQAIEEGIPAVDTVRRVLEADWDEERRDFALPPGLLLIIGEPGAGGSSTPSMVGAVQRWRKEKPAVAQAVWEELARANCKVEEALDGLRKCWRTDRETYEQVLEACSKRPSQEWDESIIAQSSGAHSAPLSFLWGAFDAFRSVRKLLRRIGREANVPIEPLTQTELLDATKELPGVLFAGVPGAGGFDAVFAVVLGQAARSRVDAEWSKRGVLALCATEDSCGVVVEERDPREV